MPTSSNRRKSGARAQSKPAARHTPVFRKPDPGRGSLRKAVRSTQARFGTGKPPRFPGRTGGR